MKQMIFTINKKGEVKIEAVGYEQGKCIEATRPFEEALGAEVSITDRKIKNVGELNVEKERLNS